MPNARSLSKSGSASRGRRPISGAARTPPARERGKLRVLLLGALLGLSLAARSAAEGPVVWEARGKPSDAFGGVLARIDDIDGDGVSELAVTSTLAVVSPETRGRVTLVSGATGEFLHIWEPRSPTRVYGWTLGVLGDIDGDGFRELAVRASRASYELISPGSRDRLRDLEDPEGMGRLGGFDDVDGDGLEDIVHGHHLFTRDFDLEGRVQALSAADGHLLWEVTGGERLAHLGAAVVPVGDLTGDGVIDLLAGSPFSFQADFGRLGGELVLLGGADGRVIARHSAPPSLVFLGESLDFLGDTDGDGRPEVVAGASLAGRGTFERTGWVGVFELPDFELRYGTFGADGDPLFGSGEELGREVAAVGDVDLDGASDHIALTNRRPFPRASTVDRVFLRSGRTGDLLQVYGAFRVDHRYFHTSSPLGDVDGDGRPEFVVTAHRPEDREKRGLLQVLRFEPEKSRFTRGDVDLDGRLTISDVVNLLRFRLLGEGDPPCLAALDLEGNGFIGVTDALRLALHLFEPFAPSPVPPFRECGRYAGLTEGPDPLPCREYPACR